MLQIPTWFYPFGSDAALWSVAVEFWIYFLAGITAFIFRDGISTKRALMLVAFAVIPLQCIRDNNLILIPWAAGAAIELIINLGRLRRIPFGYVVAAAVLGISAYGLQIIEGFATYSIASYMALSVSFASIVELALRHNGTDRRGDHIELIAWLASWSYTLYLIHHTVITSIAMAINRHGLRIFLAIVAAMLTSIVLAPFTEAHHKRLAAVIKSALQPRLKAT